MSTADTLRLRKHSSCSLLLPLPFLPPACKPFPLDLQRQQSELHAPPATCSIPPAHFLRPRR
eukprot:765064-Hanusia_phi.AAC.2